jgi:transcriptional/translational regulatory protein YebC/TACO1
MAGSGSVAWIFKKKGYILIDKAQIKNEDELYTISLDAGADDVQVGEKNYEIFSDTKDFEQLKAALTAKNIKMEEAKINHGSQFKGKSYRRIRRQAVTFAHRSARGTGRCSESTR